LEYGGIPYRIRSSGQRTFAERFITGLGKSGSDFERVHIFGEYEMDIVEKDIQFYLSEKKTKKN
tara:strand:- start:2421 stop:2612 length:192 start_codon:yes stop_codon:yes gene_type:complete